MKKRNRLFSLVLTIILFIALNSAFLASTSSQDFEEIEINFSNPEFFRTGVYDFARIPDISFTWDVGKPMLPVKGVQVLVEDRGIDRIEVIRSESEVLSGNYFIQPVQYPVANFTMPEVEPDEMIYSSDNLYPSEIIEMTGVSKMRDYPLLDLLVYPLQYKPKSRELTFYRSLRLRIYYKHDTTIKTASQVAKERRHESELFDKVIKSTVINPEKVEEIKSERGSEYSISGYLVQTSPTYCSGLPSAWVDELKYLIITGHGSLAEASEPNFENLERLAEWKKKKGVPAKVANITEIISTDIFNCEGQDNAEKVRNFIKDVYDMWGIEYVLIGGESTTVPVRTGYGYVSTEGATNIQTDLYYADLNEDTNWSYDGNGVWGETTDRVDLTPDVFIGRVLAQSSDAGADEASIFVNRILFYEKNPPTDYLTTVLFLASLLDADNDAASSANYTNATFVPSYWNATMLHQSLGNVDRTTAQGNISYGYHLINHDGHGDEGKLSLQWPDTDPQTTRLQVGDFDDFTNGYNLSIFYTASCKSYDFGANGPGTYFTVYGHSEEDGGVAWVGSTAAGFYSNSSTGGPYGDCIDGACSYSGEFNHQWFNETFNGNAQNLGVITARSKNYFVPQASSDGVYRWLIYSINLIGDPETPVWTNVPENLSVSYSVNGQTVSNMQLNENVNFTVQVTNLSGGNAISGARVCVWQGDIIYNYTTTDENGNAVFELVSNTTGDVNVTITKQNFFPLEANTSVVDEDLTAPTTTLNLPEDFYNTSSLEITFNFTSFDNVNLSNVSMWHNFTDWAINESNVSAVNASDNVWESINFTEGQYVWGVYACDNSSNCGWSANRTFTIDVTEPLISLEAPENNSANTTSNSIDFTFNVTDFLDIANCSLMINNEENFTLNVTPKDVAGLSINVWLNSGEYNWSVNCSDLVANYNGSLVFNLSLVDGVLPEVSLDSPVDGYEVNFGEVGFNFTATELYLDTCELWGNWSDWHLNQSWNGFTTGITQNFSNVSIPEGQYVWSVYCNDSSNNYNNSVGNRTFTIDNSGPDVSQKNPVSFENWSAGSVTFTYQVSDFISVSSCALYINGSLNATKTSISKGTNQTFDPVALFDDEYEWYVRCIDGAGNSEDSTIWYLTQSCVVDWGAWSDWSTCSNSQQSRTSNRVNDCPAQAATRTETQSCGGNGGSPGGGGGGGGGGGAGGVVSGFDIDFSIQRARILRTSEGAVSTLTFDGVTGHTIKIDKVTTNSATITISSEPVTVTVGVGQTVTVDVNKDGVMDLEITLDSVLGASADIVIVKLTGADIIAKEDELASKQKFSLSKKEIRTEVTQGETVQESFRVRNDGIETLALNLEIEGLEDYTILSDKSLVLNKGESKNVDVHFVALAEQEPKTYLGKIIVKTALVKKELPLVMTVKKREALFDVIVEVPEEFKEVFAGEKILAKIDLFNIGKIGKVDTILNYFIKDPSGNTVITEQETIGVETKTGFTKTFIIPRTVTPGNYTYLVKLDYKDTSTTGQTTFLVKSKISYIPSIIQKRLIEVLVWIFGIALLFTLYFLVRGKYKEKYLERKERVLEQREKSDIQRLQRQIKKLKKG